MSPSTRAHAAAAQAAAAHALAADALASASEVEEDGPPGVAADVGEAPRKRVRTAEAAAVPNEYPQTAVPESPWLLRLEWVGDDGKEVREAASVFPPGKAGLTLTSQKVDEAQAFSLRTAEAVGDKEPILVKVIPLGAEKEDAEVRLFVLKSWLILS
jgi:hypothetical protein